MARIININNINSEDFEYKIQTLKPNEFSCPYHFHHNSEELFVILEGSVTLRSPNGFRKLNNGDIIFFEKRESGAHQLYNNTTENCIYLDISSKRGTDICEYPDNNKVGIFGKHAYDLFVKGDNISYYTGEDHISTKRIWQKQGYKFK